MPQHFIKRTGGKFYTAPQIVDIFVDRLRENDFHYCEPFFGAGSVYFELKTRAPSTYAYLNDIDAELMNFWRQAVENNKRFNELTTASLQDDNMLQYFMNGNFDDASALIRAFRFYYLARSTMYGKGRPGAGTLITGSKSQFPNPTRQDFLELMRWMDNTVLLNRDFEDAINSARHYDPKIFIYCDPPYHGTEFYYRDSVFNEESHTRLRSVLEGKNAAISYNQDEFIADLYDGWEFHEIMAPQMTKHKNRNTKEWLILSPS